MALTPNDLIAPTGDLQHALFPDGDLLSRVTTWLSQAQTEVTQLSAGLQDDAARHYVYGRAYAAVAQRMAAQPTQKSNPDGEGYSLDQARVNYFQRLAEDEMSAFKGFFSPTSQQPARPASGYIVNTVVF